MVDLEAALINEIEKKIEDYEYDNFLPSQKPYDDDWEAEYDEAYENVGEDLYEKVKPISKVLADWIVWNYLDHLPWFTEEFQASIFSNSNIKLENELKKEIEKSVKNYLNKHPDATKNEAYIKICDELVYNFGEISDVLTDWVAYNYLKEMYDVEKNIFNVRK